MYNQSNATVQYIYFFPLFALQIEFIHLFKLQQLYPDEPNTGCCNHILIYLEKWTTLFMGLVHPSQNPMCFFGFANMWLLPVNSLCSKNLNKITVSDPFKTHPELLPRVLHLCVIHGSSDQNISLWLSREIRWVRC